MARISAAFFISIGIDKAMGGYMCADAATQTFAVARVANVQPRSLLLNSFETACTPQHTSNRWGTQAAPTLR